MFMPAESIIPFSLQPSTLPCASNRWWQYLKNASSALQMAEVEARHFKSGGDKWGPCRDYSVRATIREGNYDNR